MLGQAIYPETEPWDRQGTGEAVNGGNDALESWSATSYAEELTGGLPGGRARRSSSGVMVENASMEGLEEDLRSERGKIRKTEVTLEDLAPNPRRWVPMWRSRCKSLEMGDGNWHDGLQRSWRLLQRAS